MVGCDDDAVIKYAEHPDLAYVGHCSANPGDFGTIWTGHSAAGRVTQLIERMLVAEVNSAESGVLASERSRFHRNGLVSKRKDPSPSRAKRPVAAGPGGARGALHRPSRGIEFQQDGHCRNFPRRQYYRTRK